MLAMQKKCEQGKDIANKVMRKGAAVKAQPRGLSLHTGLSLQRKCACGGSSSLGECEECKGKHLQTKLSIGASNHPLEQEADRVAEQVLAAPTHSSVTKTPPRIQRYTGQAVGEAGTAPASVNRVLNSSGRPLDSALQQDMSQRFGYDFSSVRVHAGAAAEQSARDVKAHAYTVGSNIVFGAGRYAPASNEGRRLLAHELTHVVQQGGGGGNSVMPYKIEPSNSAHEQQADATAEAVLAGHRPGAITPATSSLQLRAAPYIKKITVHLTPPQSLDIEWEGSAPATATGSDHFTVSTGKGYSNPEDPAGTCTRNCCTDAMTQCAPPWNKPTSVGACCTYYGGSFWTGTPEAQHNGGWKWWTPIQPYYSTRAIALHQHTEVTGQPIGHGCVRMDDENAQRIHDYSNGRRTNVTIDGRAAPVACEPDRQCGGVGGGSGAGETIQREEDTKTSPQAKTNSQNKKVLVTGFNDWESLGTPPNEWICNANPSCRLLTGGATTSRPASYAGPLVSQLSSNRNINWEFKTLPVTWGIAQTISYQNYDAVINMGLGVYDTSDAIQLEQGAYNARVDAPDAVGTKPTSTSIEPANRATTLPADTMSDVSSRVTAMSQVQVASQYTVRVAQARQDNNFICNETHAYALSELNRSFSSTPRGRLKLVYFIHLPNPRGGASGYAALAGGAAQIINNLIR